MTEPQRYELVITASGTVQEAEPEPLPIEIYAEEQELIDHLLEADQA